MVCTNESSIYKQASADESIYKYEYIQYVQVDQEGKKYIRAWKAEQSGLGELYKTKAG